MTNTATVETPKGRPLNATAKRDFPCPRCGRLIRQGERLAMFRERATSSAEARNACTLYPMRKRCAVCAGSQS